MQVFNCDFLAGTDYWRFCARNLMYLCKNCFLGAYGTAVLYRKKDDDSLVILKEVNLHDLNAAERQLALNEVCR